MWPLPGWSLLGTTVRNLSPYAQAAAVFVGFLIIVVSNVPPDCERVVLLSPDITAVDISPSRTRILWTLPGDSSYKPVSYEVEVCVANEWCAAGSGGKVCTIFQTDESSLHVNSTAGAIYCIRVTTRAQCRDKVLTSRPTFREVITPLQAPGEFEVQGNVTGPRSALLVVSVPEVKNGALDHCLISYNDSGGVHSSSCNDHEGKQSTVVIKKLNPETEYSFTISFINIHGGREFSTRKVITMTTPEDLLNPGFNWKSYAAVLLLPWHVHSIYTIYHVLTYD